MPGAHIPTPNASTRKVEARFHPPHDTPSLNQVPRRGSESRCNSTILNLDTIPRSCRWGVNGLRYIERPREIINIFVAGGPPSRGRHSKIEPHSSTLCVRRLHRSEPLRSIRDLSNRCISAVLDGSLLPQRGPFQTCLRPGCKVVLASAVLLPATSQHPPRPQAGEEMSAARIGKWRLLGVGDTQVNADHIIAIIGLPFPPLASVSKTQQVSSTCRP